VKRIFDIIVSLLLLTLLLPVFVVVAVAVGILLGTPVLFRQQRPGLGGAPFTLLKFRTMRELREVNGEMLPDAERLTAFGRFLRRSSLDELPELFNVLRGDMSLVGPRPLLMEYMPLYTCEQARRHEVRPGITGLAQVSGRNVLDWDEKFKLDVWYVQNRSFLLDMRILVRTLTSVLRGDGVSKPGHATVDRFRGSVP
jgi:lipopolysaccharide/colanic/teichoic acid biosynthesis glycosyltransferase